ncbi:MAG: efflux transporter outer membrane subunit [Pseudomonadota bacterium]
MKHVFSAMAVIGLAGCAVVDPYAAPEIAAQSQFVGSASESLQSASTAQWWRDLEDPVLDHLVTLGLSQNLDIALALERIEAARANAARFGLQQQLSGTTSIDARARENSGVRSDEVTGRADATFVFDLFGGIENAEAQGVAALEAAEFDAGVARLAFQGELVSAYIQVRLAQSSQRITQATIRSREETLAIIRQSLELQGATQIDAARATADLATAQSALPALVADEQLQSFRLATLLNVPTDSVTGFLGGARAIPVPRRESDAGIPADLLRNRPDIRAAERRLAAASAAVGVAEAQLYPSLQVRGTVTGGDVSAWSLGPSLVLPIFNRTDLRADRDIALSEARQAEIAYRQTYFAAVEEMQIALAQTEARRAQIDSLVTANAASERAVALSTRSFETGLVAMGSVLDVERTRLENSLALVRGQAELANSWVRQQLAAGKGWAAAEPPERPAAAE